MTNTQNLGKVCPKCGKTLNAAARFCAGCGANLAELEKTAISEAAEMICPNCGKPLKAGAKFCGSCGSSIQPMEKTVESCPELEIIEEKIVETPPSFSVEEEIEESYEIPDVKENIGIRVSDYQEDMDNPFILGGTNPFESIINPNLKPLEKRRKAVFRENLYDGQFDKAEEERLCLEREAEEARKRQEEEERLRLEQEAEAERLRLEQEAEAERIRLEQEAERLRQEQAAEVERLRQEQVAEVERLRQEQAAEAERLRLEQEEKAERLRLEQEAKSAVCPQCGKPLRPGARFCSGCGATIGLTTEPAPSIPICPNCGRKLRPGAKFCAGCGKRLQESSISYTGGSGFRTTEVEKLTKAKRKGFGGKEI